jgi:hypothetical protein
MSYYIDFSTESKEKGTPGGNWLPLGVPVKMKMVCAGIAGPRLTSIFRHEMLLVEIFQGLQMTGLFL